MPTFYPVYWVGLLKMEVINKVYNIWLDCNYVYPCTGYPHFVISWPNPCLTCYCTIEPHSSSFFEKFKSETCFALSSLYALSISPNACPSVMLNQWFNSTSSTEKNVVPVSLLLSKIATVIQKRNGTEITASAQQPSFCQHWRMDRTF